MRNWFFVWTTAAGLCLCVAVASDGADAGWKMPNLIPFASQGASPGNPPTSGWKMPKLWPQTAAPKRRTNQPSTLGKMTKGTRTFFAKTADAINPWDDNTSKQPAKITGSNSIFTQQKQAAKAARSQSKSDSILPAAWWGSEKKDTPKSVNDFLSQPRP